MGLFLTSGTRAVVQGDYTDRGLKRARTTQRRKRPVAMDFRAPMLRCG